jgi:hypothetical protein
MLTRLAWEHVTTDDIVTREGEPTSRAPPRGQFDDSCLSNDDSEWIVGGEEFCRRRCLVGTECELLLRQWCVFHL